MPSFPPDPRYIKNKKPRSLVLERIGMAMLRPLVKPTRAKAATPKPIRSILVIRHNMLGDAVIASVLIRALTDLYPNASISVLASPYNHEVFSWIPGVTEVHLWPKDVANRWRTMRQLRNRFDLVFQTLFDENFMARLLVARIIAGQGVLVGRSRNTPADILLDHPVRLPIGSYAGKLLSLLGPLQNCSLTELTGRYSRSTLRIPSSQQDQARWLLDDASLTQAFILLNISARENFRSLGDDQSIAIARGLIDAGHQVLLSHSPDEANRARLITSKVAGLRRLDFSCVGTAMAAVAHARLYIGPDTGTVHFAAAAGVPCVVLFAYIARPDMWSPYGTSFISMQSNPGQAVRDIPGEIILDHALALLNSSGPTTVICAAPPINYPAVDHDQASKPDFEPALDRER